MVEETDFPWRKINDFLLDAGSAQNEYEFDSYVLSAFSKLVPADYPCALLRYDVGSKLPIALRGDETLVTRFNEYYRHRMPLNTTYLDEHPYVDWAGLPENEFYSDFLRPLGIRYILTPKFGYLPTLLRSSSSPPFTERDCLVYRTMAGHLENLSSYHRKISRLSRLAVSRAELACDCRMLSRREAEVVRLMALRMTAREIAAALLISPRTVERHIANAYEKLGVDNRADLLALIYRADESADT